MRKLLLAFAFTATLANVAEAQQAPDPRVVPGAPVGSRSTPSGPAVRIPGCGSAISCKRLPCIANTPAS